MLPPTTAVFHCGSTELWKERSIGVWVGPIGGKLFLLSPALPIIDYFTLGKVVCHLPSFLPPQQLMNEN